MKVYTKTGDHGETSLLTRQRVSKDHIRVDAYGTVDEASAAIGLAKSFLSDAGKITVLHQIQRELIFLNADLATEADIIENHRISSQHVQNLERLIDVLEQERIPQKCFVIPGECPASAALDLARTIVRRAERRVVSLKRSGQVPEPVLLYLNRLSDLLFVLARCVEQQELVTHVVRKVREQMQEGKLVLEKAKRIIAVAEKKAIDIGVPMVIAVVDSGGNLVAQHRMDGALLASISISLDKAYTAVALKMPTEKVASLALPGQPLFGLNTTNQGRIVVFGGGLPIFSEGVIIGAIGVSGGSVEEDMSVANAGVVVL